MANENALIAAASEGQIETVQALIAAGADVNFRNNDGHSALILAAARGHIAVVGYLIAAGADVNARDNVHGISSLNLAATQGHTEMVRDLIAAGADVNARTNNGISALIRAASDGQTEIVRDLIAAGADVNARTDTGYSALSLTRSNAIRQLLTDAGAVPAPAPAPAPAVTPEDRVARLIENGQRPTRLFGVENLECPVCLATDDNDKIAIVPCGHVFGRRCVEGVFRTNRINRIKCPDCRGNIGGLYRVPPEEVAAAQAPAAAAPEPAVLTPRSRAREARIKKFGKGQAGGKTRKLRRVSKCGGRTKHRKRHVKKSSCKRRKSILGRKSKKNSR